MQCLDGDKIALIRHYETVIWRDLMYLVDSTRLLREHI